MKRLIQVVVIMGMVGMLAYAGMCVWANMTQPTVPGSITPPDINKAAYSVTIENTHNVLLTDNYEQNGDVITLHGFWSIGDGKWKYTKKDIRLDTSIFGEINIRRR